MPVELDLVTAPGDLGGQLRVLVDQPAQAEKGGLESQIVQAIKQQRR
jgi:hypothetical protein